MRIPINICIFQNKKTKRYKWLSFDSADGERYLCESNSDTADQPSQKPLDAISKPGTLKDFENAVNRISDEGYDIVTRR